MKRILLSFVVVTTLLIGCSSENEGDAVIKEAELTEFEKNLINLYGGASFIHDVKIRNDQVNEIVLYIDLYQNGKNIGTVGEVGTGISEDEFKTAFLSVSPDESARQWISAVMTQNGYASGNAANERSDEEYQSSAWGGITGETELTIGEKQPVASLVYSDKNSISMIDDLSTEDALKQQTNYEEVYIFSVELK